MRFFSSGSNLFPCSMLCVVVWMFGSIECSNTVVLLMVAAKRVRFVCVHLLDSKTRAMQDMRTCPITSDTHSSTAAEVCLVSLQGLVTKETAL